MHNDIAAHKANVLRHVTVVMPWGGEKEHLLKDAIRSLPRGIRVVIAKNAGKHEMAAAFNAAIESVRTKYTFIMGADDVIDSKTLWRLWEAAIGADGAYPWMLVFGDRRYRTIAEAWCPRRLQDANLCGVMLVKTDAIRSVGGYRSVPIEDWDLTYRLAKAGYRLNPAPLARYGYRQQHDGLHKTTLREANRLGMFWADLAPYETRVEVPAVFYEWSLDGTGYVRCELASRTTKSVVRTSLDQRDKHQAESWVFQYPNSDAQEFWDKAKELGKRRIVDVDDNYVSPELERVVREFHPENAEKWAERQESHRRMVREADGVICATFALADVYRELNKNVIVCENTVDPSDWNYSSSKKKIVGVVLSRNHLKDIPLVEEACRAASRMKGVEVQVIGLDPDWDFSYTSFGFTPSISSYRRILSRWSIGLAPVIDNDVTRCKSDLKWLEFTMSKAVLVASDSEAYKRVPDDCIMRATNAGEFKDRVVSLLRDESRRKQLLRASTLHVKQNRLVGNESLRNRYNTLLV